MTISLRACAAGFLRPMAFRKFARSTISGSWAALEMIVTPSAVVAASMMFSVAPTLGVSSRISAPDQAVGFGFHVAMVDFNFSAQGD